MAEKVSRNRSSNFTIDEKTCLFTLVAEYKQILENKKTDAVTNQEKIKTWEKVTREFNSISPGTVQRPAEVLKRYYENQKKELRKKCANRKMHIRGTGGGPPLPDKENNPSEDLLLSIVNEKTVFGLNPPFGGDIESEDEDNIQNKAEVVAPVINRQIEVIYDESSKPESSIFQDMDLNFINTPELKTNFTQPSTGAELLQENIQYKTWASYKPSDLERKLSTPLKRKINSVLSNSQEEPTSGPSTTENKTPKKSSRRRPAVVVKSLTSSDVAAKYDKLLDGRLQIVEFAKKELEQRLQQNSSKHDKEMLLLDIQIEIEKEKLKKIKKSE